MRVPALAPLLLLAACASTSSYAPNASVPSPAAGEYRASKLDLYLGGRALHESDWHPVEDQNVLGMEFVHEGHDAPVGFEVAIFGSHKFKEDAFGAIDATGRTGELAVGVRKTFLKDDEKFHPYVGGGAALIGARIETEVSGASAHDDDTSGALYMHGGVELDLSPSFFLGLDLRFLGGSDMKLFGRDATADYGQLAFLIGVRF
jgi:opacity protein-like surface antigen